MTGKRPSVPRRRAADTASPQRTQPRLSGRARLTSDTPDQLFNGFPVIIEPPGSENDWRVLQLDSKTLERTPPSRVLQLLSDLSPDVSRALWDYLRLSNPGVEVLALKPGGDDQPDPQAQAWLDEFWYGTLTTLYGSPDIVLSRLFMARFLRGALFAEIVLDDAGQAVDIATPDPVSARFRRINDPIRGQVWQLGQRQRAQFIPLDVPTVLYIPVDPFPGSPYGRPMAAPALFPTLFLLGMLHDLRRVVAQQGYPRLDISLILEKLATAFPGDSTTDADEWKAFVEGVISEIQEEYSALQPDEAYIHTDVVEMNRPLGTLDASSLGMADSLFKVVERLALRALKTMPLLMGITDQVSEANANRQWEMHVAGVKSGQHDVENGMGRLLTLGAQSAGFRCIVKVRLAELRASEMFRDAQTLALDIDNMLRARDEGGWVTQDEASNKVVGHDAPAPAPAQPEPSGNPPASTDANPDPGASRDPIVTSPAFRIETGRPSMSLIQRNGHDE